MGKMKRKNKLSGRGGSYRTGESLGAQMDEANVVRQKRTKRAKEIEDESGLTFVDHDLSIKILNEAKVQRDQLERELLEEGREEATELENDGQLRAALGQHRADGENIFDEDDFPALGAGGGDDDEQCEYQELDAEQLEIAPEDEEAFDMFMPSQGTEAVGTLAAAMEGKLTERRLEMDSMMSDTGTVVKADLDPRFVELFKGVGEVLSKYRSGRLPKPFKIIPKLADWEQVLSLTEPEKWTAASMLQATRIFVSTLNDKMSQRFLNVILLPRLRDDIGQYKRLNFHLHLALKKALFKPAAFFRGILLPLCETHCTLQEATVFASVLSMCSVPVLHAAAAMLKMAEMEYSCATSLFLRVLLAKRYALPYRVIDAMVHHFQRFSMDSRKLPVLWHQALQALTVNYAQDMSSEQREALLELTGKHFHPKISPHIRQALNAVPPVDAPEPLETA